MGIGPHSSFYKTVNRFVLCICKINFVEKLQTYMLKSVVYSNLSPTIRCHGNVTLSLVSVCVTDEFHDSKNPIFIILFIYLNQTTYGSINIQNKQNTCKQAHTHTHTLTIVKSQIIVTLKNKVCMDMLLTILKFGPFWATVCKTVRPMLWDHCLVCLSVCL